ncbi:polysaccharide biosynthesis/export family protein [Ochrovirga pacifica]|uniref:polysaccharide biosynthesis/export family protein n=1 Tax=Ochrovirga pacifica TaxID=1042376 RepID=UPI0002559DF6|nr:polysaccharide biosynthesis/export family protein [Ochrovirga pacifica]
MKLIKLGKKISVCIVIFLGLLQSCTYKKDILYFQKIDKLKQEEVERPTILIQPNDILSITISALVPESAIAYNKQKPGQNGTGQQGSIELLKIQGYLVDNNGEIRLPVLGKVATKDKSIHELEKYLINLLEEEKHLVEPSVDIRLLNAKFTVLGEVSQPGTYTFTEQTLSIPQALGYAGDLTINGKRKDIVLIREVQGERKVYAIDLTKTNWINKETYYIQPNDVLVVNPNSAKVKSAGYLGNVSSLVGVISLLISTAVLLTR